MSIIRRIKKQFTYNATKGELLGLSNRIDELSSTYKDFFLKQRIDCLRDKTLNDTKKGISNENYCDHEIIVSLTTYGNRIFDVHLAIETIMQGTLKPNRIVLWLAEDEFIEKRLPITLQMQQKRGLEIYYCKDLKSYNKLIHSLSQYPEAAIITIDDDVLYDYSLVEKLVLTHIENPKAICACRIHRIQLDKDNRPQTYLKWDQCIHDGINCSLNFPTGVGGVLYPPKCFTKEVLNSNVFTKICPKADDIWFYGMALLSNTPNVWVYTNNYTGYTDCLPISPDALSLQNNNPNNCLNDKQFKAVFDKYDLYSRMLK